MTILAIETSTLELGIAVVGEEGVRAAFTARPGRRHVEMLHPAIDVVMEAAGTKLGDLDAIAVDVGPGLFTGLRTGIAAASALASALGLPVVTATSAEVLRRGAEIANSAVVPVIDMRRGELAWELPSRIGELVLGPLTMLVEDLSTLSGPILLVGDGARRHDDELDGVALRSGGHVVVAGDAFGAPAVTALGALGCARLLVGEITAAGLVAPVYLRGADVRVSWSTRTSQHGSGTVELTDLEGAVAVTSLGPLVQGC